MPSRCSNSGHGSSARSPAPLAIWPRGCDTRRPSRRHQGSAHHSHIDSEIRRHPNLSSGERSCGLADRKRGLWPGSLPLLALLVSRVAGGAWQPAGIASTASRADGTQQRDPIVMAAQVADLIRRIGRISGALSVIPGPSRRLSVCRMPSHPAAPRHARARRSPPAASHVRGRSGQVRSGPSQVRYITRPKSEAMRVTRQPRLPPRNRRACI